MSRTVTIRGERGERLKFTFDGEESKVTVRRALMDSTDPQDVIEFPLADGEGWKLAAASRKRQAELKEVKDGS